MAQKCVICEVELNTNGEQSQHYNKVHRGVSYKSLYDSLTIVEEVDESDETVVNKLDKPSKRKG